MTETQIQKYEPQPLQAATNGGRATNLTPSQMFTPNQLALMKTTICKGSTDDQFDLFVTTAARLGLDPFRKEIYAVMRRARVNQGGQWVDGPPEMTIQVGIDGYRLMAEANPAYRGQVGPFWCGADGKWRDIWLEEEPPAAAKVGVLRAGSREPVWGVCRYRAYVQTRYDTASKKQVPTGLWATSPENQLAICAERQAIRKALPRMTRDIESQLPLEYAENDFAVEVDMDTGEVLSGPEYTEEAVTAPGLRRLHQAAAEKGLSHDDLRDLAIEAMAKVRPITSLADLRENDIDNMTRFIEGRCEEYLKRKLEVLRGTAEVIEGEVVEEAPPARRTEVGYEEVGEPQPPARRTRTRTQAPPLEPVRLTGEEVVRLTSLASKSGLQTGHMMEWLKDHGFEGALIEAPLELIAELRDWLQARADDAAEAA